jgi:capsular exopolysaccharide synthesis family protein
MSEHNKYHNGNFPSNGHDGYRPTSNFSPSTENSEITTSIDEFNLKEVFYTLWNKKWVIIGTTLLFCLVAGLAAYTATPIYQSRATLMISNSQNNFPSSQEGLGSFISSSYGLGAGSSVENELEVLRSRRLSEMVADTLLKERYTRSGKQFPVLFRSYPEDSMMTSQDTVAARIRQHIAFNRVDIQTDVVRAIYESPSPNEAAQVPNMALELYKELSTRQNRMSARSATQFLEEEQSSIKNNLRESEQELRTFMTDNNVVQVNVQAEELIKQIAKLEGERQAARTKLVAANSAVDQYNNQLQQIKPGLAKQLSKALGPKMQRLQYTIGELDLRKTQLLAKNPSLSESSPRIQEINEEISSYQSRVEQITQDLVNQNEQYLGLLGEGSSVTGNIAELNQKLVETKVKQNQYRSQVDLIDAQLGSLGQNFNNLPAEMMELARLKRDVKIGEELYKTVSNQYAETKLYQQTQFGKGRIIDQAYIPKEPIKPQKKVYLFAAFILGVILSSGVVLVRESFKTTIDGVEKMKEFDEPLLAVVPDLENHIDDEQDGAETIEIGGKNVSTGLITLWDSISPISESFRRLENNLLYSNPDATLNSILVTSSGKGEGKTTTISNLGVVLAEAGYNTIIVETDFRRPNLHNMFGLEKVPGFIEILFDDIRAEEAIQSTVVPDLSVLPAGRRPPNAAAITQSKAFLQFLKSLENSYDIVLIDSPPFGIITDASAMLTQTDAAVVIAKFGKTQEMQLQQTLEQLHRLNTNIMGTVLTAFDYRKSSDHYVSSNYYKEIYKDYKAYQQDEESVS